MAKTSGSSISSPAVCARLDASCRADVPVAADLQRPQAPSPARTRTVETAWFKRGRCACFPPQSAGRQSVCERYDCSRTTVTRTVTRTVRRDRRAEPGPRRALVLSSQCCSGLGGLSGQQMSDKNWTEGRFSQWPLKVLHSAFSH